MKMKQTTVFILQNKLLKNILIYDYYRILNISIVLIKNCNRKQNIRVKNIFVDITYNAFLAQEY